MGIENSYKSIKDFLTWTTSRNTAVRVFYFGFAVILYDMWLLVDLLIQVNRDNLRYLRAVQLSDAQQFQMHIPNT